MKVDQASHTALRVMQGLLFTATRVSTAHLVSEASRDAAIRVMQRIPQGRRLLRDLNASRRWTIPVLEAVLLPGISLHYALRKRWIEDQVRAAQAAGASQVIVLGAGFDTLGTRLAAEEAGPVVIEIDHPATQRLKLQAVDGEPGADRVELLAVDFTRETLLERLPQAARFDPGVGTIVVCEGVLAYLDEVEARTLFRSVRQLCGAGTRVVFTFLARQSPGGRAPYGPLLSLYLRVAGEPPRLRCDEDDIRGWLAEEGVTLDQVVNAPTLAEAWAPAYDGALHDLEQLATATVT